MRGLTIVRNIETVYKSIWRAFFLYLSIVMNYDENGLDDEAKKKGGKIMLKKLATLLLALTIVFTLAACGKSGETTSTTKSSDGATTGSETAEAPEGTLVIGTQSFNGIFNPFFYNTGYDAQAFETIFINISDLDADNVLVDKGGHIESEEVKDANGNIQSLYTITLKEGMRFSDGEPVTIDDVIFGYYVKADPTYDGMSTLATSVDIVGLKEYFYDDPDYTSKVEAIAAEAEEKASTKEGFLEYLIATDLEGWWDGELPGDLLGDGTLTWAQYLRDEGFDPTGIEEDPEAMLAMLAEAEYTNYADAYDAVTYWTNYLSQDYIAGGLADGIDVPEISGIKKIDDYTATVLVNGVNMIADRHLAQEPIAPKHYYGEGFVKGDLSGVKAKNDAPMGSGPFVWQSYENNVVTVKANPDYFLGSPKIEYIKYQVINEENKVDAIVNGDIDITDPSASLEAMEILEAEGINYSLIGNPGYGYIAISAKRIPDINVRSGLMHLMTREQAVSTYYGELAQVIERPMTPTLGEYPTEATEYWGYDPDKALEYFKAAGYEQVNGKLVKDGEQLVVEVGIGGAATHPSTPILTQMANDMANLGGELIVSDVDWSILNNRMQNDDIDMWVAAWGNSTNADLTQLFGSESTKPGGSNRTWIVDPKLDELLQKVNTTLDFEERKALVAEELDLIMSWATYMPVYQRKNLWIYNPDTVNMDTVPANTSTYYNYVNEIHLLDLN